MPSRMARLFAGLALLLLACFAASAARAQAPIALHDQPGRIELSGPVRAWVDASGDATVGEVSRGAHGVAFEAAPADTTYRLGAHGALWLHLRLQRGAPERQDWVLEFPMPVLDRVTVYQIDEGGWRGETAGDTLPVETWEEAGRYPFFRIEIEPGQVRDIYVRIRHATATNFPMVLDTTAVHSRHQQMEYLALGTAFGALLLLIAGCLARGIAYRDAMFGWYAGYAALTGLAVSAYTGVAAHLLWSGLGVPGDSAMPVLACAAAAAAMLFMRNIFALRRPFPRLDRLIFWLAVAAFVAAPATAVLPKAITAVVVSACIVAGTLVALLVGIVCWRRGDPVAKWVVAAYLPMCIAVGLSVLRVFGVVPLSVGGQYAVVAAMTLEVPLLLVALFIRSRDRHSAEIREQALSTHDALTGLLAPHLFHDRLRQVVGRYRRGGEQAAVMVIDLVNHGRIHQVFGTAVAEQSLLRSVIKLRRLLRDVDTVSRVGEARFGVILEGASSRSSVTERASRLIAAGLMPLPGLKPDVTLQFHVAALMLDERPMEAEEIQQALDDKLARMSARTRRPIRFVDAGTPPSSEPESMFAPDADAEPPSPNLAPLRQP
ncbi:MAG TPA: 7TM diverse intracellular signaling domain-containing protein [Ramlibacter sp.]|uniref:sensor domain-containing diguanylate cyclase n=1 Tax=Ramlibacter sp. TaxID=1917967 RepID=UPI002ECFDCEC